MKIWRPSETLANFYLPDYTVSICRIVTLKVYMVEGVSNIAWFFVNEIWSSPCTKPPFDDGRELFFFCVWDLSRCGI